MTDAFRERGSVRSEGLRKLCGHVSPLYEQSERQAGQQMRRKEENGAAPTVTSCSRIPHLQDYVPCSASGNTEVGSLL